MQLTPIPSSHIDLAWRDGASCLAEACDTSGGEITGDQLKLILSRGERTLIRMDAVDGVRGWGVVRVDQLPNVRVLFVTDLVAHNGKFHTFFAAIKDMAVSRSFGFGHRRFLGLLLPCAEDRRCVQGRTR